MKLVEIKNKQNAIGGRLTPDGKNVVVAIKEGGNTVVEIIEATADIIGDIIEKATPLYFQIKGFFDDIFNVLPTFIIKDGIKYRLTLQPAGGKEMDNVYYMSMEGDIVAESSGITTIHEIKILFACGGDNMAKAKNAMHTLLEEKGYIL